MEKNENDIENNNDIAKKEKDKNKKIVIISCIAIVMAVIIVGICVVGGKEKISLSNKKENKKEENVIKELDLTKSLNTKDIKYSNPKELTNEEYGLKMTVNSDKKSVALEIDFEKFGPITSHILNGAYAATVDKYQIKGFTKNVKEAFIGNVGQDSVGLTLYYLMEDGTVEKTKLFKLNTDSKGNKYYTMNYVMKMDAEGKVQETYFETAGKIENAKDIVKLYMVNAHVQTGWITVIGATKDGSFYDLGHKTDNENNGQALNSPTPTPSKEANKSLDLTKSLNTKDIKYSDPKELTNEDYGLKMTVNSDKKSVTLEIDFEKFGPISSHILNGAYAAIVEKHQIKGFTKNVKEAFIGNVGQDSVGLTLYYLMEDGTVEKTKVFKLNTDSKGNKYYTMNYVMKKDSEDRVQETYLETSGKIQNVKDVEKLYMVNAHTQTGWVTVIGATKDGSFYDLGTKLEN